MNNYEVKQQLVYNGSNYKFEPDAIIPKAVQRADMKSTMSNFKKEINAEASQDDKEYDLNKPKMKIPLPQSTVYTTKKWSQPEV